MNLPSASARFERLSGSLRVNRARLLWLAAAGCFGGGLVFWLVGLTTDSVVMGVLALWAFVASSVAIALVLPLPLSLVSPLFFGVAGWLVDMLPLVVITGWAAAVGRWGFGLWRERRLPRGGPWLLIPAGLAAWTALGAVVISAEDLRHFLLLLGIQVLSSAAVVAVVDALTTREQRMQVVAALLGFVVVLSTAAFLEWIGVPLQELQQPGVSSRIEGAYGVDAFPNRIGLVKYTWAANSGAGELRSELRQLRSANPRFPEPSVFKPKFRAFTNLLVIRFEGSARPMERELAALDIDLIYDNVGLAEARTVPRMRSFPRNSLTYAGVCAGLFPLAFALIWDGSNRRRLLGWAAAAACLFGVGFSLARGAWVAVAIGLVYLAVDGVLAGRMKLQVIGVFLAGALVLTTVFVFRYGEDPLHARAGAEGSVGTRSKLYGETVSAVNGLHLMVGFGTEQPRGTVSGLSGRYIPRAGTHSTYLNYLFRTGIPGAVGIIALYTLAALAARAASRAGPGDPERRFESFLTAGVLILAAHAVILSLYVEPVYTLAVSLMLGLAVSGVRGLRGSLLPGRARTS